MSYKTPIISDAFESECLGVENCVLLRSTWKMTYFLIIQTLKHCFEQTCYCSSLARLTAALLTQFTDCSELAEATTTTKEVETSIKNWFSLLPSCQTLSRLDSVSFNLPNEAYNVCTRAQLLYYSWQFLLPFFPGLLKLLIVCLAARVPQISDVIISRKLKVS